MPFVLGAYQAVERPGAGHHAAPVGLWRGEDLRTIDDVALTVLPADCLAAANSAVEQVRSLRHAHLLPVTDVVADEDRVAIVCPWPRGGRLSELVGRRGRLTPAETLTVLLPVAGALAMAHEQGIRHGGVCPEAIWFDTSGRPLLGALAVGRIVADRNGGMPAGCRDVAPEVVRGEALDDNAAAAADVFSLGSVALFCLTGRSAWPADDPVDVLVQSTAGLWPGPPNDVAPAMLTELVRAMLLDDPPNRPTAAAVAEELAVVGEPVAIVFGSGPAPADASADRWRGWSTRARPGVSGPPVAGGDDGDPSNAVADPSDAAGSANVRGAHARRRADPPSPVDAPSPADPPSPADAPSHADAPGRGPAPGAGRRLQERFRTTPEARTQLLTRAPVRQAGPAEPARPTPLAKVGIAVLSGLLITLLGAQVVGWTSGQDDPTAAVAGIPADSTQPDSTPPDSTQQDSTQQDSTQPDSTPPDSTPPDSTQPDSTPPDSTQPDSTPPDSTQPNTTQPDSSPPDAVQPEAAPSDSVPWAAVVEQLDHARGSALAQADTSLLDDVYTDDAPEKAADAATVVQLAASGLRVPDAVHQISDVSVVDPTDAAAGADQVRLAVVDLLPARPIVDVSGAQVGMTPARAEERRILLVRRTAAGYRIGGIEPG